MTRTPSTSPRRVTGLGLTLVLVATSLLLGSPSARAAPASAPEGWVWPVGTGDQPPRVARGFAPPAQRWEAGHRGVDLVAEAGTPVRAAGAGRVVYAGLLAGRGVVSVVHGELRTTYEPVQASVTTGQHVAAGDVVGSLQPQGHCVPVACLHWGLRRGEAYLDPLALVADRPVRLLPLGSASVRRTPGGSGPRVGLLVRGAQPLGGDVGVDLRRRERGVPE